MVSQNVKEVTDALIEVMMLESAGQETLYNVVFINIAVRTVDTSTLPVTLDSGQEENHDSAFHQEPTVSVQCLKF